MLILRNSWADDKQPFSAQITKTGNLHPHSHGCAPTRSRGLFVLVAWRSFFTMFTLLVITAFALWISETSPADRVIPPSYSYRGRHVQRSTLRSTHREEDSLLRHLLIRCGYNSLRIQTTSETARTRDEPLLDVGIVDRVRTRGADRVHSE